MKKNVDYIEIIKDSIKIIWKKKILIVFGLFIAIGSINTIVFDSDRENSDAESLIKFISENKTTALQAAFVIIALFIIIVFLKAISEAAIIKFAGKNLFSEKGTFKDLFLVGRSYALKIIAIDILFLAALVALLITLSVPVVFLILHKVYVKVFFIGSIAAIILAPVFILMFFIKKFTYIFVVVIDDTIKNAIEKSYIVFKDNILSSFIFSLILFFIGIALILIVAATLLPIFIILGIPGAIAFLTPFEIIGKIIFGIGFFITAAVFLIAFSFFETLKQVCWTLFVKKIAGVKKEDEKNEMAEFVLNTTPETENA